MSVITNPVSFRENVRAEIAKVVDIDIFLASNLEIGIFNYTIEAATARKIVKKWENPLFEQLYITRLRTIYTNLRDPDVAARIRNGDIAPQDFAFFTHEQINPAKWGTLLEQKAKRDAAVFETNQHATTDMFTCGKCKSKKCSHYELQTRSADEPMTIFIQCLDCGKQWKQ